MGEGSVLRRAVVLPAVLLALLVPLLDGVRARDVPAAAGVRDATPVPQSYAPEADAVRIAPRIQQRRAYAPRRVANGGRIVVVGKIRTGRHHVLRVVRLRERVHGHWVLRDRDRTDRRGHYRVAVKAGKKATTRVFLVTSPPKRGLAAVRSHRIRVRVAAPADQTSTAGAANPNSVVGMPQTDTPVGDSTDWTYMSFGSDGGNARWNPCAGAIRWRYNPSGGYDGSLADVQAAFDALALNTGLTFTYLGTTSYVPFSDATRPSTADFYVGWAGPSQVEGLEGSAIGLGGPIAVKLSYPQDVSWKIVSGSAVFDKTAVSSLSPGYATAGNPTWGQVMVHEIIHGLGLGHATAGTQVMAPTVSSQNHYFGAGDLAGLAKVGATQGCLS
ncbi:MAG: hypothetical protein QM655_05475 [Nocardioidaceae bacterium]